MASKPRDYDSTIARMAGNIAAGMLSSNWTSHNHDDVVTASVSLARRIVAEVKRTEPAEEPTR